MGLKAMQRIRTCIASLILVCMLSLPGHAASLDAAALDEQVTITLQRLYEQRPQAESLADRAAAVLVFPEIVKAGIVFGGEFGEGALLVNGAPEHYYRLTSVSAGFQLGIQTRSEVVMFMTEQAYQDFVGHDGWEAGVDGSVAFIEFGAGKEFDTQNMREPIIGFVFGGKGLMANASIEGAKYWRLKR